MRGVVLPDEPGVADDRNRDRPADKKNKRVFLAEYVPPVNCPPSYSRGLRPLPGTSEVTDI